MPISSTFSLIILQESNLQDESVLQDFLMQNAFQHETWYTLLLSQGKPYDHYPLWAATDWQGWLIDHDMEHKALNIQTGVLSIDLDQVDLSSQSSLTAWLQLHANLHQQTNLALGLI